MENIKKYLLENNRENIRDIAEHGCVNGFPNFTYYRDTVKFHDDYEKEIWDALATDAEEMGHGNLCGFIASLNGSDGVGSMDQLKNLLTWYAVERAANELVNEGFEEEGEERRYKIIRQYARDITAKTQDRPWLIREGLTLKEAQAHCKDPETSSRTCTLDRNIELTEKCGPWFDGYTEEN